MTDTWILISVGLLAIGMTVLGGYVASPNKWHRRGFYVMGTLSACLIIWQGFRSQYSQQQSTAEIQAAEQGLRGFVMEQEKLTREAIGKQIGLGIGKQIGNHKVFEPAQAHLEFVFGNPLAEARMVSLPVTGGKVTIEFSVIVSGKIAAQHGALWIGSCQACRFASLPPGWQIADGSGHFINGGEFSNVYVGVHLPPMKVDVIPPPGGTSFNIAFLYTCQNCPGLDARKAQSLTVTPISDKQQ